MSRATHDRPDEGEEWMGRAIAEAGEPRVEPRPEHVASLRSLVLRSLGPPRPARRRSRRLMAGSGLAAILAAVAAILLFGRPATTWAQVAEALRGRPWVHSKLDGPGDMGPCEHWISADRERAGERAGAMTSFLDHGRKIFTKYDPAEGVVYRLPGPPPGSADGIHFLRQVLDLLLDPRGPARFPFPGMELVGQSRREVEEGGRRWLEIELSLRVAGGSRGGPLPMRIKVDPATKLPTSLAMRAEDGKTYTVSIDYPDRGPADIYDLGVPRTARTVDRVPAGDINEALEALRAGRRGFDDYCAFVVEDRVLPANYFPRTTAYRVWRKGPKWRIEQMRPDRPDWAPPADVDAAWWERHQGEHVFVPRIISDGKVYRDYYLGEDWKPGMPAPPIGPGQAVGPNQLLGPVDDPVLPFWCQDLLPEQSGHPTAGIGLPDHDREFLVESRPVDGPPGTILLRGRDANLLVKPAVDHFRLWLDPGAGHLAMRAEIRVNNPGVSAGIAFIDTHIVEAVGRSPKGHAYPTRTRQIAHNGQHELARRFWVDFEAPIPDALFEPLK